MTGRTSTSASPSDDAAASSAAERDAFHVWDGILFACGSGGGDDGVGRGEGTAAVPLKWEGTVVSFPRSPDASTVDAPRRGAFDKDVSSEVRFDVGGDAVRIEAKEQNGTAAGVGADEAAEPGAESRAESTMYKVSLSDVASPEKGEGAGGEDGGGRHELLLRTLRWTGNLSDQTVNLVFARGTHPSSGPFVSAGWMRVGNRLTVGRRYLSEDDPRAQWTLEELRVAVLEEICGGGAGAGGEGGGKARIPPWQCGVMNAQMPRKKRRINDDKDNGGDEAQ